MCLQALTVCGWPQKTMIPDKKDGDLGGEKVAKQFERCAHLQHKWMMP